MESRVSLVELVPLFLVQTRNYIPSFWVEPSKWTNPLDRTISEAVKQVRLLVGFVQNKSSCNGIHTACISSVSPNPVIIFPFFCSSAHTGAMTFVSETARRQIIILATTIRKPHDIARYAVSINGFFTKVQLIESVSNYAFSQSRYLSIENGGY